MSSDDVSDTSEADRLRRALTSDDMNSIEAALRRLGDPSTNAETVSQALPAALPLLSHQNAYYQQRAAATLNQLASDRPALIEEHIPELVRRFEEDSDHASDIVGILAKVIDREAFDLGADAINSLAKLLRETHDTDTRRSICRLMGNGVSTRAARKLHETHEIDPQLEEVAQDELEQMAGRAIETVIGEAERWTGEAARVLGYLASSHPSALEGRVEEFTESVGLIGVDIGDILASYVRHTEADTTELERRLLDIVDADEGLSESSRSRSEAALRTITEIGIHEDEVSRLVERFAGWLVEGESDRRIHAANQLATLASKHPKATRVARTELATALTGDDRLLVRAARRAFDRSFPGGQRGRFGRGHALAEATEAESIVEGLGEHLGMLRYRDSVEASRWQSTSVGAIGAGILSELRRRVRDDQSVPIILPRFSPQATVTIALELLWSKGTDDSKVAVFSPGSRTHWGLKGDLKEEYDRYGLAANPDSDSVVPLPEIVPSARIREDGTLSTYTGGSAPGRFVVTKDLDELLSVPEDDLDAILLNLTAITKAEFDEPLEAVRSRFDIPVVATYSPYTKHEGDSYPRYGPPGGLEEVDALPGFQALERIAVGDDDDPGSDDQPLVCDRTYRRAIRERTIEVIGVDSGGVSETFDDVYDMSAQLRDAGLNRAAGKIFSVQFLLERLPVPADTFDNRIYERRLEGERWLPWTTDKYIDNLQDYAGHVEDPRVPSMAFEASGKLQTAREALAEQNPLYERLKGILAEGLDAGASIAIFTHKSGWIDIIENALAEDGDVSSRALSTGDIHVVGPDTARGIEASDWLVVTGPLPGQLGGYYLLPATDRTIALTYEGAWGRMIERHAAEYIERMNDAIDGLDVRPYDAPSVDVDWEPEEPAVDEAAPPAERVAEEAPVTDEAGASATPRSADRRSGLERLAETFERTEVGEFQEDQGRYGEEAYRTYEVGTAAGERLELGNHETYLRKRPDGSHHWVSPSALSPGDTIAIIDPEVETELWREHLEELYSGELEGADATEGVRIWYEALTRIAETTAGDLGTDIDDRENLREIAEFLREEGVQRTAATIRSWFNSVLVAEDALDLARDSSLRIGPRRVEDVRSVGEAFEHQVLAERAGMIERSMNAVRTLNQSEGFEFRQELRDQLDAEGSNRVKSATTHHDIEEIELADEDADEE